MKYSGRSSLMKDKEFQSLKSNELRIGFVLEKVKSLDQFRKEIFESIDQYCESHTKSLVKSQDYRSKGYYAYVMKDYEQSIKWFTNAILSAPFPTDDRNRNELPLGYTSRAIVFYKIESFEYSLSDANRALDLFPTFEMLLHKIYCLRTLKRYKEAKQLAEEVIENHEKNEFAYNSGSIDKLIELKKDIEYESHVYSENQEIQIKKETKSAMDYNLWIHKNCSFEKSVEKGRHMRAKDYIPKNTVIFVEKSQNLLLTKHSLLSHCSNCYKNIGYDFWPCIACDEVIFCNKECADRAMAEFHQFECGFVGVLANKIKANYQGLRTLTRIGCENAIEIKRRVGNQEFDVNQFIRKYEFKCTEDKDKTMFQKFDEYRATLSLLDHNEDHCLWGNTRQVFDAIETALYLEYSNAFVSKDMKTFISLTSFLLSVIRRISMNNFGWTDMNRTVLANCICIIGSFINHSCCPNIHWELSDGKMIFQTKVDIKAGEEICITYGPTKLMPFLTRQTQLKSQYFFNCNCSLCLEDVKKVLALKCLNCDGPVIYSLSNPKCLKCGEEYKSISIAFERVENCKQLFDRMLKNINDMIECDSSLKMAEKSLEIIEYLVYGECYQLLSLKKKLSKVFEKFGKYSDVVKHFVPSFKFMKYTQSWDHLEDLLFITNAYFMLLRDAKEIQSQYWNKCFRYYSLLLRNLKTLRTNAANTDSKGLDSLELIKEVRNGKKIEFKHLKTVYKRLLSQ